MAIKAKRLPSEGMEHLFAKEKYADVLKADWLRVEVEKAISRGGWVYFIPDIAVYDENGVAGFYEIVFTHDVDLAKLHKIWNFANDCMRPLFLRTITAENVINNNYKFMLNIVF